MFISFPAGSMALMVAMLSVATGLGACALLAVAALLTRLPEGETRAQRVRRWAAGPAAGVVAVMVAGVALNNALGDQIYWLIPALGLGAWLVTAKRLRAPANRPAANLATGTALRWGLVLTSALLLILGVFVDSALPFPAGLVGLGLSAVWAFVGRRRTPRPVREQGEGD